MLMLKGPSSINYVLTLDTKEPIELIDFVGVLTSIQNEFNRFVQSKHPDITDGASFMFLK